MYSASDQRLMDMEREYGEAINDFRVSDICNEPHLEATKSAKYINYICRRQTKTQNFSYESIPHKKKCSL